MKNKWWLALGLLLISGPALATEPCEPKGKTYPSCADQRLVLKEALARAKAEKKPLLLVFGADWCPWCVSLHRILRDAELPQAKDYAVAEIALYLGEEKLPSGTEALTTVLGYAKQAKAEKGIPLMALVNAEKEKAVFVSTEPLEKNTKVSKGHDPKKLFAALAKARKSVE